MPGDAEPVESAIVDPFGVAALRAAVLAGWRASPTRLIEDSRAETDLAAVGYRDRLFIELAANAADAAAEAGVRGAISVWRDDAGVLHLANTGAPLSAAGAASLLALRVSSKDADAAIVGRFGVGFSAVVPVADRVEIRSRTATLVFDRGETERAIAELGTGFGLRDEAVPLLRLAWLGQTPPTGGFDTEIVLWPREGVNTDELLADIAEQACDRLLELPSLSEITVGDSSVTVVRAGGLIRFESATAMPGAGLVWREAVTGGVRWLRPRAGLPEHPEVLRTPTPTDIEISVPARVIARLPVTPDRRHLMPGVDVGVVAPGYLALVLALDPADRPALVPRGMGRNPVDGRLLAAIGDELRSNAWVPPASGDADLVPARTLIIADLSDDLAACLGPVLGSLAHPGVSGPVARAGLIAVGARAIGLADIAEALAGIDRPDRWWADLYEALAPLVGTAGDAEELGALPVPRVDGRRNLGARGLGLAPPGVRASWAPMVAPDAVHPLLERLGAHRVGIGELVAHEGLAAALADVADNGADAEVRALGDEVLALLAADPDAALAPVVAAELLLPDSDGELVHVDELLLPDSPLAAALGDDLPFALVDAAVADRYGSSALRRAGVGWGFLTITAQWPTAPDHDLDDEDRWWATLPEPPAAIVAVRDLDLVPDDRWSEALTLLAGDPVTAPLLADRDGYTAWWLRTNARIDGRVLGSYRSPDAPAFAGIVDPLAHPAAAALTGVLLGEAVSDAASAAALLTNLGDRNRVVEPGAAVRAYGEVVAALGRRDVDPEALDALLDGRPGVRVLDGSVVEDAVVIDAVHYLFVVDPGRAVIAGLPVAADAAHELAELLDLPVATEAVTARVVGAGRATTWGADAGTVVFAAEQGLVNPRGTVVVHDDLIVATDTGDHHLRWWRDAAGITHVAPATRA